MTQFSQQLIKWQKQNGRNNLPWQVHDPYCIWISEIMLQQTQVATVLDYYPKFIAAFPTVYDLASASQDEVLRLWAGLGYYSRARNLHYAAQQIVQDWNGQFRQHRFEWEQLKGVGRSTAAAIVAFAFGQPETILDGNVKRVLCRVFALEGASNDKTVEKQLWAKAESLLPKNHEDMPAYTQGLMDLGAMICTRSKPRCTVCPMQNMCLAYIQNRVDELPHKKNAVVVKSQTLYWAIVQRDDGAIYLQKRPNKGIWAGLFCVPMFERLDDLAAIIDVDKATQLPEIQHRLTHRQLTILPYWVTQFSGSLNNENWVLPTQINQFALPKPLLELIHKMCV